VPLPKSSLLRLLNLYPPYLGAGVRVTHIAPDLRAIDVRMKLRWWNRNYVGTQFGGSLYSMIDPFFMLMYLENLGPGYVVWDKAASIRFRRPGRGTVYARFRVTEDDLAAARDAVARDGRFQPTLTVQITDDDGELVAEVDKVLSIKPKPPRP
jgi:acyl-coenzyme A thioesterase PaaI-like protein